MDLTTYYNLIRYLDDKTFPPDFDKQQQRKLIAQSRHLFIRENILYKNNRRQPRLPLRVVKKTEVETILYNMHSDVTAGHFAFERTFLRTSTKYYWPQMGDDIKKYIQACEICQQFGGIK